jgi:hypothetical protein
VADIDAQARRSVADLSLASRVYVAKADQSSSQYSADQDLVGRKYAAAQQLAASNYSANQDYTGRVQTSQLEAATTQYGADKRLAGLVLHEAGESSRLAIKIAYIDAKFNLVWPYIQAELIESESGLPVTPDLLLTLPPISATGVLDHAGVEALVTEITDLANATAATETGVSARELGTRGFASGGPLAVGIAAAYQLMGLGVATESTTLIRLQAAQINTEQITQAQEALVDQYDKQQQILLESATNATQRVVGVIEAAGRLISSVG